MHGRGRPRLHHTEARLHRFVATRLILAARILRDDFVRAHHFVVFIFQNVTVPDVAARVALEPYDDPRDHARPGAQVKGCAKG
jgi:hypothetical protein